MPTTPLPPPPTPRPSPRSRRTSARPRLLPYAASRRRPLRPRRRPSLPSAACVAPTARLHEDSPCRSRCSSPSVDYRHSPAGTSASAHRSPPAGTRPSGAPSCSAWHASPHLGDFPFAAACPRTPLSDTSTQLPSPLRAAAAASTAVNASFLSRPPARYAPLPATSTPDGAHPPLPADATVPPPHDSSPPSRPAAGSHPEAPDGSPEPPPVTTDGPPPEPAGGQHPASARAADTPDTHTTPRASDAPTSSPPPPPPAAPTRSPPPAQPTPAAPLPPRPPSPTGPPPVATAPASACLGALHPALFYGFAHSRLGPLSALPPEHHQPPGSRRATGRLALPPNVPSRPQSRAPLLLAALLPLGRRGRLVATVLVGFARALSASPLLHDSKDTRRALAALHPQAPPPSPGRLCDTPGTSPFVTPRRSFDESLAALPMDRAAGDLASGNEELRGVAEAGAADHLFAVVCAFNDGTLHPSVYDAFEPSSLFGLRKPNGKARPIAIGDALEALAGRCMLHAKRPALRDYFSSTADLDACLASGDWRAAFAAVPGDPSAPQCPNAAPPPPPPALQLAFAPAGTDLAHFALQALYESGGAIFGHDGVNTFNTISREAAADALRDCLTLHRRHSRLHDEWSPRLRSR